MNRRDVFKLCGQLTAGLVCAQVARVLPETSPPLTTARLRAAAIYGEPQKIVIRLNPNPYLSKEYAARLEALAISARQTVSGYGSVTESLAKFRRKVEQHSR